MNKQVKKHRTTLSNRQSHIVTDSYVELDTTHKMIYQREKQIPKNVYIECLRDKLHVMIDENQEDQADQQMLIAGGDNVVL